MSVLSFIGRLLIATVLVSSAYLHYQHPTKATGEFITNYKVLDELSNKHLEFDLPYDNVTAPTCRPTGSRSSESSAGLKH